MHLFVNKLVPRLLRALIGCRQFKSILRTPLYTLRAVFLILALIADFGHLGRRVNGDCTEVARLDTPGATVAAFRIHTNEARLRVLRQRVARAGDDARRILARTAGHRRHQNLVRAYGADATTKSVELTRLGVGAHVLAQLASDALVRVAHNVLVFRS